MTKVYGSEGFDLQKYMTEGVEDIVKATFRATLRDPKGSAFMARFALASKKAAKIREQREKAGKSAPIFLISSITSSCNLHCAGCYSRANHATVDCRPSAQLSDEEWLDIFRQADELGVSFILLAGGEPMLRRDILAAAGKMQNILFPVFTNGTYMDEEYFRLLDECRNLIPVLSIEGGETETDARRGEGVYAKQLANMQELQRRGLIYGASVTVTTENLQQAVAPEFLDKLAELGCKVLFFIEYVPVTAESRHLAPGDAEREQLAAALERIRARRDDILMLSFPGDEKLTGGCLAAGRGFIHINSHGGAEPCPFSPYSDINVRETGLEAALESGLFRVMREAHMLDGEHEGGCVLFDQRDKVEAILQSLREEQAAVGK